MRRNWPTGTQAMMTVLRVLPSELYDKVVSGTKRSLRDPDLSVRLHQRRISLQRDTFKVGELHWLGDKLRFGNRREIADLVLRRTDRGKRSYRQRQDGSAPTHRLWPLPPGIVGSRENVAHRSFSDCRCIPL
jgi:hypothetical protein